MPTPKTSLDKVSAKLTFALRVRKLANAIHAAPDFRTVLLGLRQEILQVHEAQMATIYLADEVCGEIYSLSVAPGDLLREIRVPIDSRSIAGHVARCAKMVNIRNVYDPLELANIDPDLAFDASWDRKSGSRTRQVLAVPVSFANKLLGVIQLMNKRGGTRFALEDEKSLQDLAETLGIAFNNLYRSAKRKPGRYELLISEGIISEQDLGAARDLARGRQKDVETILLHEFKLSRQDLGRSLARFYGTSFVDLRATAYNPKELIAGINIEYFRRNHCVPLTRKDDTVLLAIDDPHDQLKIQEIKQVLRIARAEFHVALKADIEWFINRQRVGLDNRDGCDQQSSLAEILAAMQKEGAASQAAIREQPEAADERAIVLLVRKIIDDAFRRRASDIHFEPYGRKRDAVVRFRIDGRCVKALNIPSSHIKAVASRLKILAQLDISERRKPQDGKFRFKVASGREIEVRVSTIPTADGNEDVVLRLLATSEPLPLDRLMPEQICRRFTGIIRQPYGLVLVVGPTGSGKTTTLHSALGLINSPELKVLTAEDPVEITQYGLRQVQVNPRIGLSFAAAMRAFLRADPDVIMVGEMRDRETAGIAIEASLTGHLVLSTLHTNSAPETIIRLKDMGMDPFNFADCLLGILAQRLVRTLCRQCRSAYLPARNEYEHLAGSYGPDFAKNTGIRYSEALRLYRAGGCASCNNGGYKGRSGLYELLLASRPMKQLIIEQARVEAIRQLAIREGMVTLLQEGISNVFAGNTEFSQVMNVCRQ